MKIIKQLTNGIFLVFIGLMHTQFGISDNGFGNQFKAFAQNNFYKISTGLDQLSAKDGLIDYETFAAFWFSYFGLILIPFGLLMHAIEKMKIVLPLIFTLSYFTVVLLGVYMIPNSGITFIMLPHAIFMLLQPYIKRLLNKT